MEWRKLITGVMRTYEFSHLIATVVALFQFPDSPGVASGVVYAHLRKGYDAQERDRRAEYL